MASCLLRARRKRRFSIEPLEERRLLAADVMITEIMASNDASLNDQYGRTPDWIELFNAGDEAADLTGWYLTDNPGNLDKWTFPEVTLDAGKYLVVFASGADLAGSTGPLHTSFKLDSTGDYVALVQPDGMTVESEIGTAAADFPMQFTDVSFGPPMRVAQWLSQGDPATILIPTDDSLGDTWTGGQPFDDTGWTAGALGVGYDTGTLTGPVTYTDDFSEPHDYTAGDVAGTIWDGVYNAANLDPGSDTAGGVLHWRNTGEGWDPGRSGGPLLYKTVSGDFDVSVEVVTSTSVQWSDGGLMVRAADVAQAGAGEDWLSLKHFNPSGTPDDGVRHMDNDVIANTALGVSDRFLRIARSGDTFTFFTKPAEAAVWTQRSAISRADLAGIDLQVGFWYGTFVGNPGEMQFDNFSLTVGGSTNPPATIAYWRFEEDVAPGSHQASNDVAVSDSSGNDNPLWYWDGAVDNDVGNDFALSTDTPPAVMTGNVPVANTQSFDAGAGADDRGVLFFNRGQYGDEFALAGDFTVEGYFKTDGNQSGAGTMELVLQSGGDQTFLVRMNEAVPGELRFAVRDDATTPIGYDVTSSGYGVVTLTDENYADGAWHYFAARYDNNGAGVADELSLLVMHEDGTTSESSVLTDANFIPATSTTNMFIGRSENSFAPYRGFQGLLDELRISTGAVPEAELLIAGGEGANHYGPLIDASGDAQGIMYGVNPGAFIRVPLSVADPQGFDRLLLNMRYDDGFVAFINGQEVARRNAPGLAGATVAFDAVASPERTWQQAIVAETIDISAAIPLLQSGDNILAIHGLNAAADDPDFLVLPEIVAIDTSALESGYLTGPTPGEPNATLIDLSGPVISNVTEVVVPPADEADVVITATVAADQRPVDAVMLHWRVMFGAESAAAMVDDGSGADAIAGDGVFTGVIPASDSTPGQMVRWYVTATDAAADETRYPLFLAPVGAPEYFGTVVADPSIDTGVDVFQWFVEDDDWYTGGGNGGGGTPLAKNYTPASVYYAGEFYDNVQLRIRGASSVLWAFPKQSLKFEFNASHRFKFSPDLGRVDEMNVNALWQDKGYIRNVLATDVYRDAGVPYSETSMVASYQNGQFHSVASFAEQIDEDMLDRSGLGPDGSLYKIFNSLTDANPRPEWSMGVNPDTLRGVEKKTRQWEDNSDLQTFIDGLRTKDPTVLFDILDVPSVISYLAASVIIADWDMTLKNWYVYRDTEGTGEWSAIPWDRDNSWGYQGWMNDTIGVITSPLFHDGRTPLHDAIYDVPVLREMYLQRLRTVLDDLLQPPDTPAGELKLEARIEELWDRLHVDVEADKAKWGNPWGQSQDLRTALDLIKNNYLAPARNSLYASGLLPSAQVVSLVATGAPAMALVPTVGDDSLIGTDWTGRLFVPGGAGETAWTGGNTGVGYERDFGPGPGYEALIGLDIDAEMATNDSVYIRIPFEVADPSVFDTLRLDMKYDDGFVAYLNGAQVASANDPLLPVWNSSATAGHADAEALVFDRFDLFPYIGQLVAGTNVLAIHGLNDQTGGTVGSSSDMLIIPELLAGVTAAGNAEHPTINFGTVVFNPGDNQDEEYIELLNENATAVDISGWRLDDAVRWTFKPGTVIPAGGKLFVSPDVTAFRARGQSPTGGEGLFVQGNYGGHLSNFGETIELWADDGTLVNAVTYEGNPSDAQNFLRISEVMFNPPDLTPQEQLDGFIDPDQFEFIELANTSPSVTLNLNGVRFTDGVVFDFTGSAVTSLGPGERVLIVRDEGAMNYRYTGISALIAGEYTGGLKNGGETIKLEDAGNSTIVQFTYKDGPKWPQAADGGGSSLVTVSADADLDEWESWHASVEVGGSPGAAAAAVVVSRNIYYAGSSYETPGIDGNGNVISAQQAAIATDKTALLPGQTAMPDNVTNYSGGINGLIVDLAHAPDATSLAAADVLLAVGNGDDPAAWLDAARPTLEILAGGGRGGSDRLLLAWADDAPKNTWLEVTIPGGTGQQQTTGLPADDVFYFGNAIGETTAFGSSSEGLPTPPLLVNAADVIAIRDNPRGSLNPASILDPRDVNRDQRVDAVDLILARDNAAGPLSALRMIVASS